MAAPFGAIVVPNPTQHLKSEARKKQELDTLKGNAFLENRKQLRQSVRLTRQMTGEGGQASTTAIMQALEELKDLHEPPDYDSDDGRATGPSPLSAAMLKGPSSGPVSPDGPTQAQLPGALSHGADAPLPPLFPQEPRAMTAPQQTMPRSPLLGTTAGNVTKLAVKDDSAVEEGEQQDTLAPLHGGRQVAETLFPPADSQPPNSDRGHSQLMDVPSADNIHYDCDHDPLPSNIDHRQPSATSRRGWNSLRASFKSSMRSRQDDSARLERQDLAMDSCLTTPGQSFIQRHPLRAGGVGGTSLGASSSRSFALRAGASSLSRGEHPNLNSHPADVANAGGTGSHPHSADMAPASAIGPASGLGPGRAGSGIAASAAVAALGGLPGTAVITNKAGTGWARALAAQTAALREEKEAEEGKRRAWDLDMVKRVSSKVMFFPGAASKRLLAKAESVGKLNTMSRKWLHVDQYGQQMPEDVDPTTDGEAHIGTWPYYKMRLNDLMTRPESSRWAVLVSAIIVLTIFVSTCSFCLESVPWFDSHPSAVTAFSVIETISVQIFAVDYILRFISTPQKKWRFVIDPLNVIDLISVVPWYIEQGAQSSIQGTSVFRVIRMVRVFRVFKIGRRYNKLLLVLTGLYNSLDMLCLLLFFIFMAVIIFSTLIYFTERGTYYEELMFTARDSDVTFNDDGSVNVEESKESPFNSIPVSFWWSIVTLMTVGYGDVFPTTPAGKLVAMFAMIAGIMTLALPISVIGTNFQAVWAQHKAKEERHQTSRLPPLLASLEEIINEHSFNIEELVKVFTQTEQALDDIRGKLSDRLKVKERELADEEELRASANMAAAAVSGPSASSSQPGGPSAPNSPPLVQKSTVSGNSGGANASPSAATTPGRAANNSNSGTGRGSNSGAGISKIPGSQSIIDRMANKASDVQKKFQELVTTINVNKSYRDMHDLVQMELEARDKLAYLEDVMKVALMLRSARFPERLREMRFLSRQMQQPQHEVQPTKHTLQELSQAVHDLEENLAKLQAGNQASSIELSKNAAKNKAGAMLASVLKWTHSIKHNAVAPLPMGPGGQQQQQDSGQRHGPPPAV